MPRARDIGGFEVRRALPAPRRRMVGPFIFFDQMGPAEFITGQGIDVRPHPHIGLATVTYLYRGEFQHRDSLGSNQMIFPGELNWMVAGRGVTHSERTSPETRAVAAQRVRHPDLGRAAGGGGGRPREFRAFWREARCLFSKPDGASVRIILGSAYGARAPAKVFGETFYVDAVLQPGALLPLPQEHEDRGLYVVEGEIAVAGDVFEAGRMLVFRPKDAITIGAGPAGRAAAAARRRDAVGPALHLVEFRLLEPAKRSNYAKEQWRKGEWGQGLFDLPPDDRDEFIPLPPDEARMTEVAIRLETSAAGRTLCRNGRGPRGRGAARVPLPRPRPRQRRPHRSARQPARHGRRAETRRATGRRRARPRLQDRAALPLCREPVEAPSRMGGCVFDVVRL